MSRQEYSEVEIVGDSYLVNSFRLHMQEKVKYIVEETPTRIRAVLSRDELPFMANWHNKEVRVVNEKVFIFLTEENLNNNLGSLANSLNR